MRLKTLTQIVHEIRAADPETAVGESFLAELVEENELCLFQLRCRYLCVTHWVYVTYRPTPQLRGIGGVSIVIVIYGW